MTQAEYYYETLAARLGRNPDHIAMIEGDAEVPPVYVGHWQNWPEPGLITSFVFGLTDLPAALGKQPHEVAITVASVLPAAGEALAHLIEWQRFSAQIVPGALFHYGRPLSPETQMSSVLLFNNVYNPPKEWERITAGKREITLLMAYPLYTGEVSMMQKVGIRKFLSLPDYELFSLSRPDLSTRYSVGREEA